MTVLSRRAALRAIGLGAPAAGFIAEKIKRDMLINPGIANIGSDGCEPATESGGPVKFTRFADWFKRVGHSTVKNEARHISGFDADIIDMHLPMVTKVRMQRTRNYARLLEGRKDWFSQQLSACGMVKWWP